MTFISCVTIDIIVFCLQCYLNEMQDPDNFMPTGIQNKHKVIFGNMQEIYEFHNK